MNTIVTGLTISSTEARTVPSTLSSQVLQENANPFEGINRLNELTWKSHDFYNDEAVVAKSMVGTATTPSRYSTAQQLWYSRLVQIFRKSQERHRLWRSSSNASNKGRRAIRASDDVDTLSIKLICEFDRSSRFEMLRRLTKEVESMWSKVDPRRIHRAVRLTWSTLACLDELETLGSEEVAEVRAMGKAATIAYAPLLGEEIVLSAEHGAKSWKGKENNVSDSHAATAEHHETLDQACHGAHVWLDIIITITGEVFGQRDLLEYRTVW